MSNFSKVFFLLILIILIGCTIDDEDVVEKPQVLEVTSRNLSGSYMLRGIYIETEASFSDENSVKKNLLDSILPICRREDLVRFIDGPNRFYHNNYAILCEGDTTRTFQEVATWTLDSLGKLKINYETKVDSSIVVNLTEEQLILKKLPATTKDNEEKYQYEEYLNIWY